MKLSQTNGPYYAYYGDDLYATLSHVKEAGFSYVDVSFFQRYFAGSRYFTEDNAVLAEEYKRALDALALVPVQSHEPSGNLLGEDGGAYYMKKTPRAIDLAGRIGIPSITLHPGLAGDRSMTREELLEKNAEMFKKHIPLAEKYGIKLLIENLPQGGISEGTHISSAKDLNELLDRINHPLFGACWDVGHGNLCRLDQYQEIKLLGDRLGGLHLHDNYGNRRIPNNDLHQTPFWGEVNYDAILAALIEIGYKGTFNFEVDAPGARNDVKPFVKDGIEVTSLKMMTSELRLEADKILFAVGKYMLEAYECFEA